MATEISTARPRPAHRAPAPTGLARVAAWIRTWAFQGDPLMGDSHDPITGEVNPRAL